MKAVIVTKSKLDEPPVSRSTQGTLQWGVKSFEMAQQIVRGGERFATEITGKRPFADVGAIVFQQVAFVRESFVAVKAQKRLQLRMNKSMSV